MGFEAFSGRRMSSTETSLQRAVSVDVDARFGLIKKLISTPEKLEGVAAEYFSLEEMIRRDFLKLAGANGIPGESRLFNEMLLLLKDLRDLVEFPHLANKNILAIGGGFSSGKSRFINAMLGGERILPTGINPTTAIPTFITTGECETLRSLNTFNRSEALSRQDFAAISHAFNENTTEQSSVSFYHILKLVQIQTPAFRWRNIALLDTPGYSKPHVDDLEGDRADAGNTDEERAREHLSRADQLIWAIPAVNGTVRQDDIEFLKEKVKWDRPIYLLITKCDQSSAQDLEEQIEKIRTDFSSKFKIAGWSAYSAKERAVLFGDDPEGWFDEIDGRCKHTQWHGKFGCVVDEVIRYGVNKAQETRELISALKPIYLKNDEDASCLNGIINDLKEQCRTVDAARKSFEMFKDKLNRKLEAILAKIGVSDEVANMAGVVGTCDPDPALLKLHKGSEVAGCITLYRPSTGCYITIESSGKQVAVKKRDLVRHYTDPEQYFAKGMAVSLEMYGIDTATHKVQFIVRPRSVSGGK